MIYLFVDVDGVFNSRSSDWNKPGQTLDQDKITQFMQMLTDKCYVVLSSSWRHYPDPCKALFDAGLRWNNETDSTRMSITRAEEIEAFINERGLTNEEFLIIDDDYSVCSFPDENVVYTQFNIVDGGLNKGKMIELKQKLNRLLGLKSYPIQVT